MGTKYKFTQSIIVTTIFIPGAPISVAASQTVPINGSLKFISFHKFIKKTENRKRMTFSFDTMDMIFIQPHLFLVVQIFDINQPPLDSILDNSSSFCQK